MLPLFSSLNNQRKAVSMNLSQADMAGFWQLWLNIFLRMRNSALKMVSIHCIHPLLPDVFFCYKEIRLMNQASSFPNWEKCISANNKWYPVESVATRTGNLWLSKQCWILILSVPVSLDIRCWKLCSDSTWRATHSSHHIFHAFTLLFNSRHLSLIVRSLNPTISGLAQV